jgi:hypothetical protein
MVLRAEWRVSNHCGDCYLGVDVRSLRLVFPRLRVADSFFLFRCGICKHALRISLLPTAPALI